MGASATGKTRRHSFKRTPCSSQGALAGGRAPLGPEGQDGVERGARAHGLSDLLGVGVVVAANVHRLALAIDQLLDDRPLVGIQLLSHAHELHLQLVVLILCRKGPRPVQAQVEVAAAVVDLATLPGGVLVDVEEMRRGLVQAVGQDLGLGVLRHRGEVLNGHRQGQVLAQGVPAQVVALDELLHVLGRGAAGARLVHAAAGQHRHDRQHLGARAELDDGEQVRIIITQHVARHRDGVLPLPGPVDGHLAGLHGRQDVDVQAGRVVLRQVPLHLLDHDRVVPALGVQPEDHLGSGGAAARHGQLHPVLDRDVLRLAHAPDVTLFHLVLQHHLAGGGMDDADRAVALDLEGLVVGAVLLRLLGHEADVGHGAHGRRVERTVLDAVIDRNLEDPSVAAVGDDGLAVVQLVVGRPHLAGGPDHRGHRGVDDDIARHVQVGDALVGVHHRHLRALGVDRLDVGLDGRPLVAGQGFDLIVDIAQAVLGVDA
mmetsp:Transcript_108236/g.149559  ORF Transcript_108236/g.149559 Transcript_108236/m.149559 type:complete len:486 (-) Transcript_108236:841-2298(-)